MSWQEQTLVWEQSQHSWSDFGITTPSPPKFDDDTLHAKPLVVWKEQSLGEIIKKISDAISAGVETIQDPDSFSGFLLAVAAINLFPLHIKIVWEDEHARLFLDLLHEEDGFEFLLKSELETVPDIEHLIKYFEKNKIVKTLGDRIVIQGKVLNRAFLKS